MVHRCVQLPEQLVVLLFFLQPYVGRNVDEVNDLTLLVLENQLVALQNYCATLSIASSPLYRLHYIVLLLAIIIFVVQ